MADIYVAVTGRSAQDVNVIPPVDDDAVPGRVADVADRRDSPWWDLIGYRRRFISDRGWFGLAFLATGLDNLHDGSLAWLSLIAIPVGLVLLGSTVRRFRKRAEAAALAADQRRQSDCK